MKCFKVFEIFIFFLDYFLKYSQIYFLTFYFLFLFNILKLIYKIIFTIYNDKKNFISLYLLLDSIILYYMYHRYDYIKFDRYKTKCQHIIKIYFIGKL